MPKKFQLEVLAGWRWVETTDTRGTLQFTDIVGDEYYASFKVHRLAFVGRGSAVAYYLTALAPRETVEDESDTRALHKSMVIFGEVDPWSTTVRGDGYINHEKHLIGHWGKDVSQYSTDYMRRAAFVVENERAFQRAKVLGAELVEDAVYSIKKEGDVYAIFTKNGKEFYYAAFVVAAMGLGPHRGLESGKGAPRLPKTVTGFHISDMKSALAASVMDLDRFMREYPERDGIDTSLTKRLTPVPSKLTIVVHGANAGIDAVQRAWQLGHQIIWLCPAPPAFLKGNRLPISKPVDDVTTHALAKDSEVYVSPEDNGQVKVVWSESSGEKNATVDVVVVAVGQDPYAQGAVGDVLFKTGNIPEDGLSMIWDFDQVFGLPFQTILGYQIPGHRKGFGLQIIGASCEVLTRSLNDKFPPDTLVADFKRQLTPLDVEPIPKTSNEQIDASPSLTKKWGSLDGRKEYHAQRHKNWERAIAQRERFIALADAYLKGLAGSTRGALMELLSHQIDPTKVPKDMSTILETFKNDVFLIGQLATPEWPGTTAGASVLLPSQVSSVRAVVAALASFIPEYILRGDSNFSTDDRTMLAVYIARNFQGFSAEELNARVSATMSLRRGDGTPLGFHDDELRKTIQDRWRRESKL